jgi:hypothetical protein
MITTTRSTGSVAKLARQAEEIAPHNYLYGSVVPRRQRFCFTGGSGGDQPISLIPVEDGSLYGTTGQSFGTAFKLVP